MDVKPFDPGPENTHALAADGDGAAFSALAALYYHHADAGVEPAVIALARAVEFGRLAAMKGGRREWIAFLYLLEEHSHALRDVGLTGRANSVQAEAFVLAEEIAEQGDEELAEMVVTGAAEVDPAVLMIAREMRRAVEPVTEH